MKSKNYESVQKTLYTLTAMILQLRHSVQQLQQDDIIINTINTEVSDTTETSAVCDLYAQEASCDKCDISITNTENSDATKTSAIYDLYAQKASCDASAI